MNTDDLIFEPFNLPTTTTPAINPTHGTGIIDVPGDFIRVDIQRSQPMQLYTDAAAHVIDLAVAHHPGKADVRQSRSRLPLGILTLGDLVANFHAGFDEVWISRPQAMPPTAFKFAGRFGYFKFMQLPQQLVASNTLFWFWIDTDQGQLAAIDLGLLIMHPTTWYHVFIARQDAERYYTS